MKSVFKIVLNKLRSTFRRSADQNLEQQHQSQEESKQDDSEQSSKLRSSKSDSSLGTCGSSVLLGNQSKSSDVIENEFKNKGPLLQRKHQTVIRCSSATCSPRLPSIRRSPNEQFGSSKSTKSARSFGSYLFNKSIRSDDRLNDCATVLITSSTTNLLCRMKDTSDHNSNDTLSTTSSIAMLSNKQLHPQSSSIYGKRFEQQLNQKLNQHQQRTNTGSVQSLSRGESPDNSSSHLSSLADTVPDLPNINDEYQRTQQGIDKDESSSRIKDLSEVVDWENASHSTSSPNLNMQPQSYPHHTPSSQKLLISQSMSMEEPDLSDTDSLIAIETDQGKCRSKSVDASVVIAMRNQNLTASSTIGLKGKPRGSTTFLEIPKWRLFVRKQSNASATALNGTINMLNPTCSADNLEDPDAQVANNSQTTNQAVTKAFIKLADIFKDCIHCKIIDSIERKKSCDSSALSTDDLFFSDNNNNTLTENQTFEEEDEEESSSDISDEEPEDCSLHSFSQTATSPSFFQGNDFSSTAVYHQQQTQHTSSIAKDSGVRRYVKNRQRRSSYNVTYFSKPTNVQQPTCRPSSATGFVKKSDDKTPKNDEKIEKKSIIRLPSVTLSEASDDEQEQKDAMNNLLDAASGFSVGQTQFISIQITEPSVTCCENELEDPGSGITVVSLEVPVLNSGKQARSASVDSSFLQVPQRTDIEYEVSSGELPPAKSIRSRSVDIALPEGPDGLYLVVPTSNQRPATTK